MQSMDYTKTESGLLVPHSKIAVGGIFKGQIIRNGDIVDEFEDHNIVVNEGLNHMLDVTFRGATQTSPWYLGIFEGNYTPVSTVTGATIVAASTECTAYTASTRPEYVEAAAASQSTTNSANRASFVFNATKTIYGAFLISTNTKSDTAGKLFAAAQFASSKSVVSGDELLLTYTFNASSV